MCALEDRLIRGHFGLATSTWVFGIKISQTLKFIIELFFSNSFWQRRRDRRRERIFVCLDLCWDWIGRWHCFSDCINCSRETRQKSNREENEQVNFWFLRSATKIEIIYPIWKELQILKPKKSFTIGYWEYNLYFRTESAEEDSVYMNPIRIPDPRNRYEIWTFLKEYIPPPSFPLRDPFNNPPTPLQRGGLFLNRT